MKKSSMIILSMLGLLCAMCICCVFLLVVFTSRSTNKDVLEVEEANSNFNSLSEVEYEAVEAGTFKFGPKELIEFGSIEELEDYLCTKSGGNEYLPEVCNIYSYENTAYSQVIFKTGDDSISQRRIQYRFENVDGKWSVTGKNITWKCWSDRTTDSYYSENFHTSLCS